MSSFNRNLIFFIIGSACTLLHSAVAAQDTVQDIRAEDLIDPLGIETERPRLSWRMESERMGAAQSAYHILVATEPGKLKPGLADLWDSGKKESDAQRLIPYEGVVLPRGEQHFWTVRIWNEANEPTAWSAPGHWSHFDLFEDRDWKAQWIELAQVKGANRSSPWMRKNFEIKELPEQANIYVNALGFFELFINGQRVSEDQFTPHVGQYDARSFAITYDVKPYLKKGRNVVAFWMGSGWSQNKAGIKLKSPIVRAQLELASRGGELQTIITDASWKTQASYMQYSGSWNWNKFGGEIYLAGEAIDNWAALEFDDSDWPTAAVVKYPDRPVSAEMMPRNRVIDTIQPVSVQKLKSNQKNGTANWLVDMGQAMTGTFGIRFPKGPKGHKIDMTFGDSFNSKNGRLGGSFNQKSSYIMRGSGEEIFRNRFNWASCQYVLLQNVPEGEMRPEDIRAQFISAELDRSSTFECSDDTLNAIYRMMNHTLKCLMLGGYQVDCHSRERMGYGGDGFASLDTTLSLFRSDAFYRKWLRDWVDQQRPDGNLSYTSPRSNHGGGPFWCGFLITATLKHYHHYGDVRLVEQNFPAVRKWLELAQSKTVNGLQEKFVGGWYLGDWASDGVDDKKLADIFIQAYMSLALEHGAQLAEIIDQPEDARRFRQWAQERKEATNRKYFNADKNIYGSGEQVEYILPLVSGVVPEPHIGAVLGNFEKTLRKKDKGHLSTGLSGTYLMVQYLQSIGRDDLIYLFASKRTQPSWGYMIANGATATWEHWSGNKGTRIHNCFNSIGSWFIQGIAGIQPDPEHPGFKNAIIRPAFLKELSYAKGSHDSVYGTIRSEWKREGGSIALKLVIPANSTASVHLPLAESKELQVNGEAASKNAFVRSIRKSNGGLVMDLGSGSYTLQFADPE
ncbi:MAG: family 78 glycoside hydrolase catalytic domain [Opitutales bacterium]